MKNVPASQVYALLLPISVNVSNLGIEWFEHRASDGYAWIRLDGASIVRSSLDEVLNVSRTSRDKIRPFKGGGQAQRGEKSRKVGEIEHDKE